MSACRVHDKHLAVEVEKRIKSRIVPPHHAN
jgi:hypothetical protein